MAIIGQKMFTTELVNSTFNITAEQGIRSISVLLISGAGTVTGNLTVGATASSALNLALNTPITLETDSPTSLVGISIEAPAGTVQIIARQ